MEADGAHLASLILHLITKRDLGGTSQFQNRRPPQGLPRLSPGSLSRTEANTHKRRAPSAGPRGCRRVPPAGPRAHRPEFQLSYLLHRQVVVQVTARIPLGLLLLLQVLHLDQQLCLGG